MKIRFFPDQKWMWRTSWNQNFPSVFWLCFHTRHCQPWRFISNVPKNRNLEWSFYQSQHNLIRQPPIFHTNTYPFLHVFRDFTVSWIALGKNNVPFHSGFSTFLPIISNDLCGECSLSGGCRYQRWESEVFFVIRHCRKVSICSCARLDLRTRRRIVRPE